MGMHWRRQMFTAVLLVGIIMVTGGASGGAQERSMAPTQST